MQKEQITVKGLPKILVATHKEDKEPIVDIGKLEVNIIIISIIETACYS